MHNRAIFFCLASLGLAAVALTGSSNSSGNLVGYWKFDEGTGTFAADSSTSGNNGTVAGRAAWVAGEVGNALAFNIDGPYVQTIKTDVYDSLSTGTIMAWVKWNGRTGFRTFFSADSGNCQHPLELAVTNGQFEVWADSNGCNGTFEASAKIPNATNTWHNLAYVVSTTGNKLYVDGLIVAATYPIGSAASRTFFSSVAAAQETTLNAVLFVPRNTTFGEIFVRFVEQVNKEGKGLVQIKLIGRPDAIRTMVAR